MLKIGAIIAHFLFVGRMPFVFCFFNLRCRPSNSRVPIRIRISVDVVETGLSSVMTNRRLLWRMTVPEGWKWHRNCNSDCTNLCTVFTVPEKLFSIKSAESKRLQLVYVAYYPYLCTCQLDGLLLFGWLHPMCNGGKDISTFLLFILSISRTLTCFSCCPGL